MEAIFGQSSAAPYYQQVKNTPKRNRHGSRSFISRSGESLPLSDRRSNVNHGGGNVLLGPPPPSSLSFSYPPSLPALFHTFHQQNPQQQPPLLPLPVSMPQSSLSSLGRRLSCPPTSRKNSRNRDHSLTPKKSKQPTKTVEPRPDGKLVNNVVEASEPLGPDPSDLPKDVSKVLSSLSSSLPCNGISRRSLGVEDLDKLSGSVHTPSPHPSSLPLPKFSVRRPKLVSRTTEAGVDDGATDSLRRLLRLG
uniref:Uncharacterized protein MANES_18G011900 n=1 Tax=Rhizophora mucronata TaxID=61149 RepID=A0A2P2QLL1_RHIMU